MADKREFDVVLEQVEDGGFAASVPELSGCWTQGDTRDEALANAKEAIAAYLEAPEELGRPRQHRGGSTSRSSREPSAVRRDGASARARAREAGWNSSARMESLLVFASADRTSLIVVPNHPDDLRRPLVAGVLKDAAVSTEELLQLF